MRIAICQYDIQWEKKEENKKRIRNLLDTCARKSEIDWLIFSEMCLSGFTMDTSIAELSNADRDFFSGLASENNINISYGGVEERYNNLITLDRTGKRINTYSKMHLYSFGGEDRHYSAGTKTSAFELEGLKVVPAVCFDLRFPYLFWNMADKADIYVVIAAWPARRSEHWKNLVYARAVENQCYCVGVNRTGHEGKLEFSGNSVCYDPLGKVVLDAGTSDGVFVSDVVVESELVGKTRDRFPFISERKKIQWE